MQFEGRYNYLELFEFVSLNDEPKYFWIYINMKVILFVKRLFFINVR